MLHPISNGIFFIFEDDVTDTKFANKTKSGIALVAGTGDQVNIPRWGTAILVGPECEQVQAGDYILVEKGMWTPSFKSSGLKLWKTDETKVLCTSDEALPAY
jgi:hypothetical protein